MGLCTSQPEESGGSPAGARVLQRVGTAEAKAVSAEIDSKLFEDQNNEVGIIKLLLLGSGESGKSTFIRQFRILHGKGWTEHDRSVYRTVVQTNALESAQCLCRIARDTRAVFHIAELRDLSERFLRELPDLASLGDYKKASFDVIAAVKQLWADPGFRAGMAHASRFQLMDSAEYFLDRVTALFANGYEPSDQDILRSRVATTGVVETPVQIDNIRFAIFDVGGQRGERRKWIHAFENVTAILFIASLSEYDMVLAEDPSRNRLQDSLGLFQFIIEMRWFHETPVILFLNKKDVFAKKILRNDLRTFFPDYHGGADFDAGVRFIRGLFEQRDKRKRRRLYVHVTDATDTQHFAHVWKDTREIILQESFRKVESLLDT